MCQKKKAFVENRDQYRGVFSFCSIGVLLAALTGCFAFIWYRFYSDFLLLPFYRRGNWVMILLYAVLVEKSTFFCWLDKIIMYYNKDG